MATRKTEQQRFSGGRDGEELKEGDSESKALRDSKCSDFLLAPMYLNGTLFTSVSLLFARRGLDADQAGLA